MAAGRAQKHELRREESASGLPLKLPPHRLRGLECGSEEGGRKRHTCSVRVVSRETSNVRCP